MQLIRLKSHSHKINVLSNGLKLTKLTNNGYLNSPSLRICAGAIKRDHLADKDVLVVISYVEDGQS